jgi:alcohol dehydrogenase class IV
VERIAGALADLFARAGLPAHLRGAGVTSALLPTMAELAMEDVGHETNPRPVTADDLEALYRAAL